jgi:cardiolipin synthase
MVRVLAAPVVAWLLYTSSYRTALLVLLVAGVTDWLDGYAARKLGMSNRLGIVLDPLADKILLFVVFVTMGLLALIPRWLFVLVVVRDLVIVTGSLLLRLLRNRREFVPSLLGKMSTFFQLLLALLALVQAAFPYRIIEAMTITGVFLAAIYTLVSGLDYVRQGIQMARLPPLEKI